ncbi:MAG: endo-1,4-beta-xylanase [Firmicutes bacterium]|nr:endo-1,4-beta-xylanase [Bacillota bacterium]
MYSVVPELLYKILSFFLPCILFFSGASRASLDYAASLTDSQAGYTGLCEAYAGYFPIGAAVYSYELDDPRLEAFILKNFNMITPEWELKQSSYQKRDPADGRELDVWAADTVVPDWQLLQPGDPDYRFRGMDRLAEFALAHGLKIRGHTLIWPVQDVWMLWTDNTKTQLTDKETLFARMDAYIGFIMGKYGGVVDVWDVVNEPFHYNRTWQLKQDTDYYRIAGEAFVTKAFELAAKYADANDVLMVNETFVEGNAAKTDNMFCCVERWRKQGVRIDGIATQGHMGTVSTLPFDPEFRAVDTLAKRCRKLGVKLEYTEIDIKIFEIDRQRTAGAPPDWLETWQIFKYKKFFEALRRNKDVVIGATFWGLDDAHSVITYGENGPKGDWPMLFGRDGLPKQNFFAVCDF